jgi:2-polyprenyl-6-methoxyphenol hydroxylase-like FAD-dependent oxidoreductase
MSEPILIVGAGPTGLTAALELTRLNIPVRLIDKREAPATTSRAIGIQARTLELFEQRGLADAMVRLGNKASGASIYSGGKRAFRLDYSGIDSRYNYTLFLSQAETERILRDALAKAGVAPEWRTEMVAVAQDAMSHGPEPVSAVLKKDGSLERVATSWLISAEGAHSLVRTTLDLQFEGKTLDEQYALGDLHIDGDLPESDFHIFSSEHGFMGLFPMGGSRFRLIASNPLSKPSKDTAPSSDELQTMYDQRSPIPARFHDTTWTSWFRINSRMVPRLRIGRLLLGGDSAHIHSPAGAQGMNTGIQDMINLGWKLALVIRGQAPESLLDSYPGDRLPVMRNVLFKTENLTAVIGAENPLARGLFNHLAPHVGALSLVQENSTARMSQIAIGYRDGPLSDNHVHAGSLHAGDRVPDLNVLMRVGQQWREARMFEALSPSEFALVVTHDDKSTKLDPVLAELAARFSAPTRLVELAASARDQAGRFASLFGTGCCYLVRPDGYVAVAAGQHGAARALSEFAAKWLQAPKSREKAA